MQPLNTETETVPIGRDYVRDVWIRHERAASLDVRARMSVGWFALIAWVALVTLAAFAGAPWIVRTLAIQPFAQGQLWRGFWGLLISLAAPGACAFALHYLASLSRSLHIDREAVRWRVGARVRSQPRATIRAMQCVTGSVAIRGRYGSYPVHHVRIEAEVWLDGAPQRRTLFEVTSIAQSPIQDLERVLGPRIREIPAA
jgi:hypothetical protein